MGRYFGTDGVRGEANKNLKVSSVYRIGRYLGNYYAKNGKGKIVIGKDTRLSSSMFENALACGIAESGSDTLLAGYCTTPCLAYLVGSEDDVFRGQSMQLEPTLTRRNVEHTFRYCEAGKAVKLGHSFPVLYPEYTESVAVNREMLAFFRNRL